MMDWKLLNLIEGLGELWLLSLGHFFWQGILLAVSALGIQRWFINGSASFRYRVLLAHFILLAALPFANFAYLYQEVEAKPFKIRQQASIQSEDSMRGRTTFNRDILSSENLATQGVVSGDNASTEETNRTEPGRVQHARWQVNFDTYRNVVLGVYLLIVLLRILQTGFALQGGRGVVRNAAIVEDPKIQAKFNSMLEAEQFWLKVRLLTSERTKSPAMIGWLCPTIVLPFACLSNLSASELEAILWHELAHVRRYDFPANLFQRLVEAMFFFHPAVWIVSRQLRIERENCCDDFVLAKGTSALDYAQTLTKVAHIQLRNKAVTPSGIALFAAKNPSTLRRRINRMLFAPVRNERLSWNPAWSLSLVVVGVLVASTVMLLLPTTSMRVAAQEHDRGWGASQDGLRMRIVAVKPTIDEQAPSIVTSNLQTKFSDATDITVIAEIQNVSNEPIRIAGIRYGRSVSASARYRVASNLFAPKLFRCQLVDRDGKTIDVPVASAEASQESLELSSCAAEQIEPSESVLMALYPVNWNEGLARAVESGKYQLQITYLGVNEDVQEILASRRFSPEIVDTWKGELKSAEIPIEIENSPVEQPRLNWGETINGLSLAVEYRLSDRDAEQVSDYSAQVFPIQSKLNVIYHLKNNSDEPVNFKSASFRRDDRIFLVNQEGEEQAIQKTWYSGWPRMRKWEIAPDTTLVFTADFIGVKRPDSEHKFPHVVAGIINVEPGTYELIHDMGDRRSGLTKLEIRDRKPSDEPRRFSASIGFVDEQGEQLKSGFVRARSPLSRTPLFEGEFSEGQLEIPNYRGEALQVYVRSEGFEEARFNNVTLSADDVKNFTLKSAKPVKLRLQSFQAVTFCESVQESVNLS